MPARRHRTSRARPSRPPRGRASTPSSPPPTCTSSASCASRASSASRRRSPPSRQARQYTDDVQFSAEDATRSDLDFLCRVIEAVIDAGATTINLPDTVGYSTPDEIEAFFTRHLRRVPNASKAIFSTHCHDDLGLAVANSLAAMQGGARQVECTINGIGERAGNASLEEIVMATHVRARPAAVRDGIDTQGDLRDQPAAHRAHRRGRPGQQGHRRAQRVRARGRHPPGRHAEGPADLRDHAARGRRRAADDARARQALGPARARPPDARSSAWSCRGSSSIALPPDDRARRRAEERDGRRAARDDRRPPRRRRTTTTPRPTPPSASPTTGGTRSGTGTGSRCDARSAVVGRRGSA